MSLHLLAIRTPHCGNALTQWTILAGISGRYGWYWTEYSFGEELLFLDKR